jgi:hypothetical protein
MYFSNQHSLGAIFKRDMTSDINIENRRRTVVDFVLSYLRPSQGVEARPRRRKLGRHLTLVS